MTRAVTRRMLAILPLALVLGACGKEAPRVDPVAERKAALERAKEGAFGTQVQALESAKTMEADLNRKATEMVEKVEADAK